MKTLDDYFTDWESHVFGFGYGTGELHTLPALHRFFAIFRGETRGYDHGDLEAELGPLSAWLLINTLCHADIIEYGTSPRFGWLTQKGLRLKEYVDSKSDDELYENVCSRTEDYSPCYPYACNCGEHGYEEGRVCQNPFWLESAPFPAPPAETTPQ